MMGIADIFEALTARDRPYKRVRPCRRPSTSSTSSCQNGHIDPGPARRVIGSQIYRKLRRRFLSAKQVIADFC